MAGERHSFDMLALLHLLSLVALVARGVVVLQQFVRALFAPVLAQRWVDDVAVQICSCLSCPSFGKIVPQYDPAVRYSGVVVSTVVPEQQHSSRNA